MFASSLSIDLLLLILRNIISLRRRPLLLLLRLLGDEDPENFSGHAKIVFGYLEGAFGGVGVHAFADEDADVGADRCSGFNRVHAG